VTQELKGLAILSIVFAHIAYMLVSDSRFLYPLSVAAGVGVYSYETYLLHWPLMSRYDVFYHTLPAWIATIAWLAAFIGLGWMLRKVLDPIEALVDRR